MIIPVGHRVLVKAKKYIDHDPVVARARQSGLVVQLDKQTRYDASVDTGVIVSVGTTAWKDFGGPWADVGDTVVYAKHAGRVVDDPSDPDNENKAYQYVLMNDEDVIAVVKE